MSDPGAWNIRWDGPTASAQLGRSTALFFDINENGKNDVILPAPTTAFNGTNSGSIYIIYDELYESLQSSGNTIDLANTANFNIRIDGQTEDGLGIAHFEIGDINGDDHPDLVFPAYIADHGTANSGSLYFIYNQIFQSYTGTGNIISLNNSANYNLRIDGPSGAALFGASGIRVADVDVDGKDDVLVGAFGIDKIYLMDSAVFDGVTGTGNVMNLTDPNSYTIRFDGDNAAFPGDFLNNLGRISDVDGDGNQDLMFFSTHDDRNGRNNSGTIYVLYHDLFDDFTGTGNTVDMSLPTSFNMRIEGSAAEEIFGVNAVVGNIDADQGNELIMGAFSTDIPRANAGAIYVMDDTLISTFAGTGNIVDLANSANWNLRIDGREATENLVFGAFELLDFNNDGKQDVVTTVQRAPSSQTGGLYIIYNEIFDLAQNGTGNTLDMATFDAYLEYNGAAAGDLFGSFQINFADANEDGSLDMIAGATGVDNNSRSASGSAYLIYNFPHQVTLDVASDESMTGSIILTGTVTAPDSVTLPAGVQYTLDGDNLDPDSWTPCTAQDGAFDSADEAFTCTVSNLGNGNHTISIRAYDENSSYGAPENFAEFQLEVILPRTSSGGSSAAIREMYRNTPLEEPSPDEASPDEGEPFPENRALEGEQTDFSDVTPADWFAPFLEVLVEKGIFQGYAMDQGMLFKPEQHITRAELTKVLVAIFFPEFKASANALSEELHGFSDLEAHWSVPYVQKALDVGWLTPAQDFRPDEPVLRSEAAKLVVTAFGAMLSEKDLIPRFFDVPLTAWFSQFVQTLYDLGIVEGYTDGLFHPEQFITRAEMAKILVQAAEEKGIDF